MLLSLSLFLSLLLVALWHLNGNLLHPGTLFVSGHLLLILPPHMLGFVSEKFSQRGIDSERQVILSDFFNIDLPLSSIVGVGSHFVASQSLVPP